MADAEKIIDELFGPEPDLEEEPVGEEAAQPDEVVAPSDPDPSEAEPEAAPTPDVTGTDVTDQGEDPVTEGSSPEETGSESDSGSAELSGDESERERGLLHYPCPG
jgi:hypothetical protein